ncbi:MAG: dihydrolipoyl dehydrogenase [Planctomycetota bacterium]
MAVGELTEETQLLVIGGGPGGYVAAFRAADLGIETTLVDQADTLGGVCLREGCVPSKALLHVAHLIESAGEASGYGVTFNTPDVDVTRLREWKQSVIDKLCGGVKKLAKKRRIRVIQGRARFEDSQTVGVDGSDPTHMRFKDAIIATGSSPKFLPAEIMPADCCMSAADALDLPDIPGTLLVVGGGYIGLELGQVYALLGSQVTVVEALPHVMTGCDADLARPLLARLRKQFAAIHVNAQLESARRSDAGIEVSFSVRDKRHSETFERVLSSVGRYPNSADLGLENTRVTINEYGFIEADKTLRTSEKHIYAIGDVIGNPMLAHKASREGIVAAEVIAGKPSVFEARAIPAVVYSSPEIAWCGITEAEAKEQNLSIKIGKFRWGANSRALTMGRPAGTTKIIADAESQRVLGVGIVGEHAGDLIAEAVLAMEMGATVKDLARTIHPHPTTSETIMEAAESVFGSAIHAYSG